MRDKKMNDQFKKCRRSLGGLALFAVAIAAAGCQGGGVTVELGSVGGLPRTISQSVIEGGTDPASTPIDVSNTGQCPLQFAADAVTTDGAPWLTVTLPTTDIIAPAGSETVTVNFPAAAAGLAAGTYTGSIVFSATCTVTGLPAVGSPKVVAVNLTVTPNEAILGLSNETPIAHDLVTPTTWLQGGRSPLSSRIGHTAVWDGRSVIVWGGRTGSLDFHKTGARYFPASGDWQEVDSLAAPSARYNHYAVWTGTSMIVYGGANDQGQTLSNGGRYDPATDSWFGVPTGPAASISAGAAAWTGSELFVLGEGGAALYDPAGNSWRNTAPGAPAAVVGAKAVWTGRKVVVIGGAYADWKTYDVAADKWSSISTTLAPAERNIHSLTWTGKYVLVYGGQEWGVSSPAKYSGGGRYDPEANRWAFFSISLGQGFEPAARGAHRALWTGAVMIVFGGIGDGGASVPLNDGGYYDQTALGWTGPLSTESVPVFGQTNAQSLEAVFTGTEVVFIGTLVGGTALSAYRLQ